MTNRFAQAYRIWTRFRETKSQLMQLSDRDLADIGIKRGDIETIAFNSARL